jgi:urea transport system permease protein
MMGVVFSLEIVVWVAVGGRGYLAGAILGALLVNWAKSGLSESFPDIWSYFQGALFIGAVLLFPSGLVGFFKEQVPALWARTRRQKPQQAGGTAVADGVDEHASVAPQN